MTQIETQPHHGARLAKIGLIAAMASRLTGRLVGIVLVVLLARQASPDTVAIYGYLLGTATLVVVLTDLGVSAVAGREVASGRMPVGGALHAALAPQAVSVGAAALVTLGLTLAVGPAGTPFTALALTVGYVVAGGFNNLWSEMLRASGRVVAEGVLQAASSVALVVGGVLVVRAGGNASELLAVVALKEVVVLVVAAVMIHPRRDPTVRSRDLIGQGLWVALAGTALILLWRQGTLVLGAGGTIGALAAYVVASRFLDAGVTIAHTAGFGLVPGVSALAADPVAFRHAARRYIGFAATAGALVALVGVLAAEPITVIPFGNRWADAVPAVRVIALTGLPILVAYVAWPFLNARRQVRLLAGACASGTATALAVTIGLVIWQPDALSATIGTFAGSVVLSMMILFGLRDVLLGHRPS